MISLSLALGESNTTLTPSSLTGLALWLRSDNLIQSGGFVSQWTDKSTNANNVSNSGGSQPTYITNNLNGLPGVGFPALNHDLKSTTPVVTQGHDRTVFMVGTPNDPVATRVYCSCLAFNLSAPYCIVSCGASSGEGFNRTYNDGQVSNSNIDGQTTYPSKTAHLFQWSIHIGSPCNFYIDNVVQANDYSNNVITNDTGGNPGIAIGGFSQTWAGVMNEIVILDHIATSTEQNQIRAYANSRYALGI